MSAAIAFCFDARFQLPLAVALRSVLETWKGGALRVHLVHSGLPPGAEERIRRALPLSPFLELFWHEAPSSPVRGLPSGLHFSNANYFRLLLPELLPGEDSLLYLDSDTLALSSLDPLFRLLDPALPLQACRDYIGSFDNPLAQLPDPLRFGIPPGAPYFNSGVLLMNLRAWREERLSTQILRFAAGNPDTLFLADQSAINIVLHGRIGVLPPEWNCQQVHAKVLAGEWKVPYLEQDISRARVLHYTTEHKPWTGGSEAPMSPPFHAVRARLPWDR